MPIKSIVIPWGKKVPRPKEKRFNGKPMSHWEKMAKELVVSHLVRASYGCDSRSLPGRMAGQELMGLAARVDRVLTRKIIDERETCIANLHRFISFVLPDSPKKTKKKPKK